jgi:signal transduction histidine kinase
VATTVIGPEGRIAVGTRVSEVVREKVLERGDRWLDRAFVVDDWYLSTYEPIKNPDQGIIGILYVGVLEKHFLDIRNRALLLLSSIVFPALFLFVGGVYLISRSIVRPVAALARASERIASGELETRVEDTARSSEMKSLAASFNQMAEAVRKRERMLTEKNDQLAEANRDYQELLSFVTHELNNSVGSLLLNVSLLIDSSTGEMDPEKMEIAGQVLRDVERFRDMVRNYLNISRLEKGTLRYHPEMIDPRDSVAVPVLKRLRPRIDHRNMEVRWEWACREPVMADRELLDICYSNLLVNALKYGEGWISLTCRAERDGVVLGVRNGGSPIPEDKLGLLFRKFSRLVKSDDGAGLGLYLVYQIIERHGGTVWCESSRERGTGFYMKLPRAA